MSLFRNRHFSAGSASIAVTFFALTGATFYLAYFLQAVRGYTPLAAGVALIAVAGGGHDRRAAVGAAVRPVRRADGHRHRHDDLRDHLLPVRPEHARRCRSG